MSARALLEEGRGQSEDKRSNDGDDGFIRNKLGRHQQIEAFFIRTPADANVAWPAGAREKGRTWYVPNRNFA